ncbi:hypothetical protein HMN09_00258500 [Mycena chlorophos]|nr:hypothetical protein HMN09_00258500 [Mycena chlorophos]
MDGPTFPSLWDVLSGRLDAQLKKGNFTVSGVVGPIVEEEESGWDDEGSDTPEAEMQYGVPIEFTLKGASLFVWKVDGDSFQLEDSSLWLESSEAFYKVDGAARLYQVQWDAFYPVLQIAKRLLDAASSAQNTEALATGSLENLQQLKPALSAFIPQVLIIATNEMPKLLTLVEYAISKLRNEDIQAQLKASHVLSCIFPQKDGDLGKDDKAEQGSVAKASKKGTTPKKAKKKGKAIQRLAVKTG